MSVSEDQNERITYLLREIEKLTDVEKLLLYLRLPPNGVNDEASVGGGSSASDSSGGGSSRRQTTAHQAQSPNQATRHSAPLAAELLGKKVDHEVTQTYTWILSHLEEDPNVSLPKQEVYDEYKAYCQTRVGMEALCVADFGKAMKHAFPCVKPRRLGQRGNSRYCYSGLRKKYKLMPPTLPDMCADVVAVCDYQMSNHLNEAPTLSRHHQPAPLLPYPHQQISNNINNTNINSNNINAQQQHQHQQLFCAQLHHHPHQQLIQHQQPVMNLKLEHQVQLQQQPPTTTDALIYLQQQQQQHQHLDQFRPMMPSFQPMTDGAGSQQVAEANSTAPTVGSSTSFAPQFEPPPYPDCSRHARTPDDDEYRHNYQTGIRLYQPPHAVPTVSHYNHQQPADVQTPGVDAVVDRRQQAAAAEISTTTEVAPPPLSQQPSPRSFALVDQQPATSTSAILQHQLQAPEQSLQPPPLQLDSAPTVGDRRQPQTHIPRNEYHDVELLAARADNSTAANNENNNNNNSSGSFTQLTNSSPFQSPASTPYPMHFFSAASYQQTQADFYRYDNNSANQ